ncbi:transcriptional regulator [Christiangramia fulva]|uniref:Transcriptional regulator n=1 Tax=Christiangramia fulva TaxID=2126553 RepID=A0A2R3Z7M3_9FLAO|nr:helix-turn-helix transcriptional regulator [Christiangramia fulva]AVR46270.1 transcriptional regulator [Christiangramia fulva]
MVNTEQFAERLQKILEYYELSAAAFADEIEVGRSSISHIISGRNKPSLDFVMKVVKKFPEVELYWLLNGKGSFPSSSASPEKEKSAATTPPIPAQEIPGIKPEMNPTKTEGGKTISKIVIFYTDGSFEAFEN